MGLFGKQTEGKKFLLVHEEKMEGLGTIRVLADKETGTQYLYVTGGAYLAGLTVMTDENGKPKIYKGPKE
ncbi:MAG: DUF6440 family protein [Lawsonibacter sp.]